MDFMTDLSSYLKVTNDSVPEVKHSTNRKAGQDMDMSDYLQLMVATFQNQSIDDVASTSDMVNQMVQMSVIQAITSLNSIVSQSSSMTYAASLVGKEVTIGQGTGDDAKQIIGKVTGTGMMEGEQVIFLGDKMYNLSDVIAVGRVPSDVKTQEIGSDDKDKSDEDEDESGAKIERGGLTRIVDYEDDYDAGFTYVADASGAVRMIYKDADNGTMDLIPGQAQTPEAAEQDNTVLSDEARAAAVAEEIADS